MDSQALYRKWRPQRLSDVAGQEQVTRALKNALERGRLVHAYLFCGPRGTGKTSTGRILAKAVNCLAGGRGEPCNTCSMCQAVTTGSALDVIEIDAASNRGIDEIRDLREKVNFSPNSARYKVYIIDEVHMLTDAAANALLKTLEEPPPYVIFVLATTESHKLLPTILSRCQRYDFRRLTQAAVSARLAQICAGEGFQVQPEALGLIARSASGSLRDAVNLLEQMVNYYGAQLELSQVQSVLGITGDQRSRELARHLISGDNAAALQTLNAVAGDGLDLRQFHRELLEYMRQLLLVKSGSASAVETTAEDVKEMQDVVSGASLRQVLECVKLLGKVDMRLETYSPLPLEMAIVECSLVGEVAAAPKQARPGEARPKAATAQPRTTPSPSGSAQAAQPPARAVTAPKPSVPAAAAPGPAAGALESSQPSAPAREQPPTDWERVVGEVRKADRNIAAYLGNCEPKFSDDGTVVLPLVHEIWKTRIEAPNKLKLLEDSILKVTGKPYKVQCTLVPREKKEQRPSGPQGHLVQAALKMGARIINAEEQHAE